MKVAIYARVSTEGQRERDTIANQLEFAQNFCALNGHEIVGTFADNGVSGTIPMEHRREGARLLDAARQRQFEAVVFYRVDRFSRSLPVLLSTVAFLRNCGVALQSMAETFDTSTSAGELAFHMFASFAQFERASIQERTAQGRERGARQGKFPGGNVPFGYRVEDKRLLIEEGAADVVRDVFRLYLEGKLTIWIAAHLSSHGVPLPSNWARRGATAQEVWNPSVVLRILSNTIYKGEYRFGKRRVVREEKGAVVKLRRAAPEEHIVVSVPAIIDVETFDSVQKLARENRTLSKRNSKRDYILRRLVTCGRCSRNFIGHPNGPRFYYVCSSQYAPQIGVRWCGNPSVRAERIEQAVWDDVCAFIRAPGAVLEELRGKLQEERPSAREVKHDEKQIEKAFAHARRERENVVSLVRKGLVKDEDVAKELRRAIQAEVDQLEREHVELLGRIRSAQELETRILTGRLSCNSFGNTPTLTSPSRTRRLSASSFTA